MTLPTNWATGNSYPASAVNTLDQVANAIGLVPETFGAVGNGTTDDTTALQNWLNAVTHGTGSQVGVLTPSHTYKISSALTISNSGSAWVIDGSFATIRQSANNVACIAFTTDAISNFAIRNLTFDYASQQSSSGAPSGGVAAVTFDTKTGSGFGWYNGLFDTIQFTGKCYRGFMALEIGSDVNAVWGCTFRKIWGNYGMTGSLIRLHCTGGCPNNEFDHLYSFRNACTEPSLDLENLHGTRIVNFEVNESDLGGTDILLAGCFSTMIDTYRHEIGTNVAGDALILLESCYAVTINNWELSALPFANTGYFVQTTGATTVSIGPGEINTYSPYALPGANLHMVSLGSGGICCRYEGIVRPSAVVDGISSITTGSTTSGGNTVVNYI